MNFKKKVLTVSLSSLMSLSAVTAVALPVGAVGNGPSAGNGQVTTSNLHTYESLVSYLKTQDAKQERLALEVIGETVKGRDIYLAKYISNPKTQLYYF